VLLHGLQAIHDLAERMRGIRNENFVEKVGHE